MAVVHAGADVQGDVAGLRRPPPGIPDEHDVASSRLDEPYTFADIGTGVLEVLDDLEIQRAHFVGMSLGSMIVRTITEMAPERVQSMVFGGAILRLTKLSRLLVFAGNAVSGSSVLWL
jgi:pimeloyl-ACP methyl ester carboxylesterase